MITLNGERGFEQVDSWEDILHLPGFTINLNPEKKQLKEIIGRYIFPEKISCGLSTCRQPHGRGYIVITQSGEVTNIGNVCGKNHFGVKFDEYSKVFTQALTDHQNRETITSFLFQLEGYVSLVSDMRSEERGADWVYRTSRALVERNHGCPDIIVTEINKMVRARSRDIRVVRIATEDEAKELEVIASKSLPRPQHIEELKGNLNGIACLYHESNIREILILDVEKNLTKLAGFNVDEAPSNELRVWAKWCQELEDKLIRVQETIKAGRALLTSENLSQFFEVIHDQKELKGYKEWLAKTVGK
jgi:hypothetical protein